MDKEWWFLYIYPKSLSLFEQEKISTPEISLWTNMTINTDFYHNTKVYSFIKRQEIKENYKYWLTILNSSVMWFFLKNTWYVLRWWYFTFKTNYLLPFWLPKLENIEQQNIFIEKADFMLDKNKELQEKINKFLNRLKTSFWIEKLSWKLENFYLLDFGDFVKELSKNKVNLSLKDQDEWEDYFTSYKKEALGLKSEIDNCDKEIDEMVFDLYGLNEEERKVVLGGNL